VYEVDDFHLPNAASLLFGDKTTPSGGWRLTTATPAHPSTIETHPQATSPPSPASEPHHVLCCPTGPLEAVLFSSPYLALLPVTTTDSGPLLTSTYCLTLLLRAHRPITSTPTPTPSPSPRKLPQCLREK